jgi:hypothetical protein
MITTFTHPKSCRFADDIAVEVNGIPVEVLRTDAADFANFIFDPDQDPANVTVRLLDDRLIRQAEIRPLKKKIQGNIEGQSLTFPLKAAHKLSIEIEGHRPLFLWANPPEIDRPDQDDPSVVWFASGQVHEVGVLGMTSGQTIYIEGGAVVKGRILTGRCENITIRGHGIFDGSYFSKANGEQVPSINIGHSTNVCVRDITMIHPSGWMLLPGDCDGVDIFNLKQIGEVVSSDGIDICGSRNVHIHDCFLRNNDDCVVIKAFHVKSNNLTGTDSGYSQNVENVLIENCTLLNAPAGNAMEIGHELTVDHVRNVTFRNIDVLSVHGLGAVFSIHNFGSATVEDILFEDIRIEHCYALLIDIWISRSRFTAQREQGQIRNVTFKDIDWHQKANNRGYTKSVIGGWNADHTVEGVFFENFQINGAPITDLDQLEIFTRYADDIQIVQ